APAVVHQEVQVVAFDSAGTPFRPNDALGNRDPVRTYRLQRVGRVDLDGLEFLTQADESHDVFDAVPGHAPPKPPNDKDNLPGPPPTPSCRANQDGGPGQLHPLVRGRLAYQMTTAPCTLCARSIASRMCSTRSRNTSLSADASTVNDSMF